jgi:carbamate kinase
VEEAELDALCASRAIDEVVFAYSDVSEAACRFVEHTGRTAAIGAIEHAELILNGSVGTIVHPFAASK